MSNPAPDQLELVRTFVNTYDHEDGTERLADPATLTAWLDDHGDALIAPRAGGVDGALGHLLVLIADAQRDGTWSRLKACPAEDCQFAFYDRSRNRSAVWCDMKVCGNRAKVRQFRTRHEH